ncbi:transposase [Elysia marginata]|uniref:Transposase n=1 Tax=Elysia marginata TaxID=1093978 RepID=A0AAV4IBV7_9GAST|nr:transposase [Elysia marginata]
MTASVFLGSIITGDESWVHHYDPERKMQSMQYRHKNSPAPKKFKVVASARKKHLKGNHNETDAEVEADVRSWCRSQTPEIFADGMRKLVERWRLCIERDGDYVEK